MHDVLDRLDAALGGRRAFLEDGRFLLVAGGAVYLFSLLLRLSLWTQWENYVYMVGQEFILSTQDSYFWLAKARDVSFTDPEHLAWLTKIIHSLFGFSLGDIGFWAPAFLASLVAPVCLLWGWLLGGRAGGLVAGMIGPMGWVFYLRSRLGYYDTDLFTLLMPLIVGFLLSFWVGGFIRRAWLPGSNEPIREPMGFSAVFVMGLFIRMACWWHQDLAFMNALLVTGAGLLVLMLGRQDVRLLAMVQWTAVTLLALPGMGLGRLRFNIPGNWLSAEAQGILAVVLGVGVLLVAGRYRGLLETSGRRIRRWAVPCILLLVLVGMTNILAVPLEALVHKLGMYFHGAPAMSASAGNGVRFPSVVASIVEAARIDMTDVLEKMAVNPYVGAASLVCAAFVLVFRPEAILLLPTLLVALAGAFVGSRFTMFGSGASAVFCGVCLSMLGTLVLSAPRFRTRCLVQILIGVGMVIPAYIGFRAVPATPVMSRTTAATLLSLQGHLPDDAVLWTWWDWGYATWYYTGIRPPIDGGRHSGADIYPMAYALTTDSPERANQMLFYATANDFEPFRDMAADGAVQRVASFGESRTAFGVVRPQYLVVCWENVRLLKWISFFGNWNLKTGQTLTYPVVGPDPGTFGLSIRFGLISDQTGKKSALKTLDVLDREGVHSREYPVDVSSPEFLAPSPHLLVNGVAGIPYLLSDSGYDSMLVRLLRDDPDSPEIKQYFRLVAENLPYVRVYELVRPDK